MTCFSVVLFYHISERDHRAICCLLSHIRQGMGQVLQTDNGVWVLCDNAMADLVIRILFQPSLSSTDDHQTAGNGTSAFLLQPLFQSRIVIGFSTNYLQ